MFYYLEGRIAAIEQNMAVVDIGGAGYACHVTANTLSRLEVGKVSRLYTYCYVREDAFDIYGFYDLGEKRFFEQLLTVSGVGPKAALSILSAATPEALALAVINGDERALTMAPGVGKKTAQRVILELKDKVAKQAAEERPALNAPLAMAGPEAGRSKLSDAAAALAVLGYTQGEITAALRSLDTESMTVEEIVRCVLKSSL